MKRLLLVDDDLDILEFLSLVLGETYEVITAIHAVDALSKLMTSPYDVVVLDLMMPGMDGEALVKKLRGSNVNLPILLASAVPDLVARARRLGVDCIGKPYNITKLEAKLAYLISGGGGGGSSNAPTGKSLVNPAASGSRGR